MLQAVDLPNQTAGRPEDRLSIRLLKAVATLYGRVYHQITVRNPPQLPSAGPAIIVCNHTSSLDPVLIQACIHNRLIHWMMAAEYMKLPVLGRFFRTVKVIPVARSGRDFGPLREALRVLHAGRVLGIFPEGRIAPTRQFLPMQSGLAMMAIKTGAAIYPVYLDGSQRNRDMVKAFVDSNTATLRFGPPISLPAADTSREALEAGTERIRQSMEALRDAEVAAAMAEGRGWLDRGNGPADEASTDAREG